MTSVPLLDGILLTEEGTGAGIAALAHDAPQLLVVERLESDRLTAAEWAVLELDPVVLAEIERVHCVDLREVL